MIVRFDFEDDVVFVIKSNDPGVVFKHADAPVVVAQITSNLLRGGEDRFLEHVLETLLAVLVAISDSARERLVAAMLAPCLGDRFQFRIRRISPEVTEILLNRLHFDQRKIELTLTTESSESFVVQIEDGDVNQLELVGSAKLESIELDLLVKVMQSTPSPMSQARPLASCSTQTSTGTPRPSEYSRRTR